MTREVLVKRKITGYMLIDFKHPHMEYAVECLLCAVDYDKELFTLRPVVPENPFDKDEFYAYIGMCEFSRHKLKILK